jgi:ketosteroid isomerase-like protein
MRKSTETLLTDFYDAWRTHDLDLMGMYLPDDFSHLLNIPAETLSVGGLRQGKRASLKRLAEIFDGFDTQYLQPGRFIVRDSQAIVEVHTRCRHRASGAWLDTRKQHVWQLEDGWPVKLSEFYDLDQFKVFMSRTRR